MVKASLVSLVVTTVVANDCDKGHDFQEGSKCKYHAVGSGWTNFPTSNGLQAAKDACVEACHQMEACKFAGVYFDEGHAGARCDLYGEHCGEYDTNLVGWHLAAKGDCPEDNTTVVTPEDNTTVVTPEDNTTVVTPDDNTTVVTPVTPGDNTTDDNTTDDDTTDDTPCDEGHDFTQGWTCPQGAVGSGWTNFPTSNGLEAAKEECVKACREMDLCKYAGLYFNEGHAGARCDLYGEACGEYSTDMYGADQSMWHLAAKGDCPDDNTTVVTPDDNTTVVTPVTPGDNTTDDNTTDDTPCDEGHDFTQGFTCPQGAVGSGWTNFPTSNGFEAAKEECVKACREMDLCKYAGLYFNEGHAGARCDLYGEDCGEYSTDMYGADQSMWHLAAKGNCEDGRDLKQVGKAEFLSVSAAWSTQVVGAATAALSSLICL